MKRIKSILISCLLSASMITLTSCNDSNEEWMQNNADNVLKIETSIVDTRAVVTGTEFKEGDKIGIYAQTSDGHEYTGNSSNVCAMYGRQWGLLTDITLRKEEATIYAYYPYNASTVNTNDSINIDISPVKGDQPDYMYGSFTGVNQEQTTAKIAFKHALARVTLAITKSPTDVGEGKISNIRIENDTLYSVNKTNNGIVLEKIGKGTELSVKGKMSLKDGGIRNTLEQNACIEQSINRTINEKEKEYIDFLVMPCGQPIHVMPSNRKGGKVCAIITIDGFEYKVDLGYPHWVTGKQYTYPITINRATMIESSVTPGEKIYMGFNGDNGKPLYWSSYNLGAKSPEEEGGYYGWGDPTGKHTEQCRFNDGRYADTYMADEDECMKLYGGINPPNNISGTEYDTASALWGGGWRTPSKKEFELLRDNCKRERIMLNGVDGYRFTSYINGNSLFLPNTTQRFGNVMMIKINEESGLYWTSTFMFRTMAYHIMLTKMNNNYGGSRWTGYSIRPVTE